ncbi:MAG: DUF924 domain-containing protein [Xanthomonadaceae bacterium]|nr:DUF924 domain-containing protein [Xanthomonadaceae bacterium]
MAPAAKEVLAFWFAEANAVRWFARDDAFDAQIRADFGDVAQDAADGLLDGWTQTPLGWLALLIVLDQFSRNLYRDDPRAWAQDAKAQALALAGIDGGSDRRLPPLQRVFAYLPLEHAEDPGLQRRSVELFEALCGDASPEQRASFETYLEFARAHHEVIACFGRFPHRNATLGRPSTPAELAYLATPGVEFR